MILGVIDGVILGVTLEVGVTLGLVVGVTVGVGVLVGVTVGVGEGIVGQVAHIGRLPSVKAEATLNEGGSDGIVPGGGIALLNAREALKDIENKGASEDFKFGYKVVYNACGKPFEQILFNAGYSEADARMIIQHDLKIANSEWAGYDIKTCSVVNMKEAGILDPHKVTKQALSNAASIAGTILLTECVVVDKPEDKKEPSYDPSMMGMM